jgi:hypothetical protein
MTLGNRICHTMVDKVGYESAWPESTANICLQFCAVDPIESPKKALIAKRELSRRETASMRFKMG